MIRDAPPEHGTVGPDVANELCVFIDCESFLCAVAVSGIDRLVLADDVSLGPEGGGEGPAGALRLAFVDGAPFVVWDLSTLLAVPSASRAYLLLRLSHGEHEIPVALCTGPCLFVEPLRAVMPIPEGVFRSRRGAVAGAFPVAPRATSSTRS